MDDADSAWCAPLTVEKFVENNLPKIVKQLSEKSERETWFCST